MDEALFQKFRKSFHIYGIWPKLVFHLPNMNIDGTIEWSLSKLSENHKIVEIA